MVVARVEAADAVVFIFAHVLNVYIMLIELIPIENFCGIEGVGRIEVDEVRGRIFEVKAESLACSHATH